MVSSPTTSIWRKNTRDTTRRNHARIRYATLHRTRARESERMEVQPGAAQSLDEQLTHRERRRQHAARRRELVAREAQRALAEHLRRRRVARITRRIFRDIERLTVGVEPHAPVAGRTLLLARSLPRLLRDPYAL